MVELSIVIPAYNELERLPPTLAALEAYLKVNTSSWEIIVSDDGSRDGSLEKLPPKFPEVTFLRAPRNQGKGAAVRRGMLAAKGNLVLFSDADLSTPIDELAAMREAIEKGGYDVAIASRGLPGSRLVVRQPWYRELSGRVFNQLVRPLSGLPFRDTQCGFKLFSARAARGIFGIATANGFAFDVEILIIASLLGLSVAEMPVRWINVEGTKLSFFKHGPRMVMDILKYRWWRFSGKYQDQIGEGRSEGRSHSS